MDAATTQHESASANDAPVTFVGERIWTGDPDRPRASRVTMRGGKLAEIDGATSGRVVVLGSRFLAPAFLDAHLHITLGATTLSQCDLAGSTSRSEFESRIAKHVAALDATGDAEQWFVGFGWNESDWRGSAPDGTWLAAAGNRPAVAWRMDQHACVVNRAALARLDTSHVDGGEIEADRGIFREQAAWKRVIPAIPEPSFAAKRANLARATAYLHGLGLAGGGSMEYLRDIRDVYLASLETLDFRVHATVLDRDWPLDHPPELPRIEHPCFRIVGMKSFADGTLGSRTAWMLEPYADAAHTRGLSMEHTLRGELAAWMRAVQRLGLSPSVHAIGDRAARALLDACDACHDHPAPRLEHMQTLAREDLPRVAGRFASMQPLHKADDARQALARLGAGRIERFFPFRALLAHGARLAFGSDWPIVSPDPLLGIKAAVTGLDLNGRPFATEHSISVEAALAAYTRVPAEMLGFPGGMLREGRAADLVVLDRSPFEIDWTREMPRVVATIVGSRPVHGAEAILGDSTRERN
ncbi:MAG: amidohydrolase family protein [Planctomycetaceae bacterium]|nr:amidohydrolase family protein [Planctomycetaceae bacterium]